MLGQGINLIQIPHPFKATFKFPLSGQESQSNSRDMPGGGMLKLQFDRYVRRMLEPKVLFHALES